MRTDITDKTYGFVYVVSYVGLVGGQSVYECECLDCGAEFQSTYTFITRKSGNGCNACKDRRFTWKQDSVVAFRYSWFGHSVAEIAAWYKCTRPTVYASLKRSGTKLKRN